MNSAARNSIGTLQAVRQHVNTTKRMGHMAAGEPVEL
jgi:hypothetical protein